jgi:hypothetical protein
MSILTDSSAGDSSGEGEVIAFKRKSQLKGSKFYGSSKELVKLENSTRV